MPSDVVSSSALTAFAEALFATKDGPPPPAEVTWVVEEFQDHLRHAGQGPRWLMRLALFAVSLLAPLFVGAFPTLKRLPLDKRVLAVHRMEESVAGPAVLALKAFLCLHYFEHPDVQARCGYVGFGFEGAQPAPWLPEGQAPARTGVAS